MYAARRWSVRHAKGLARLYAAFEGLIRHLHPLCARIGYGRLERPVGHREIHVQLGCQGLGPYRLDRSGRSDHRTVLDSDDSLKDLAGGRLDGDLVPIAEHLGRPAMGTRSPSPGDRGHAELTTDDGCVARASTGIGDETRGTPHDRHPIR